MTALIAQTIRTVHPQYEILEAHDGFRAGTLLATHKPDVVLLDLMMPGMDGFDICRLIRSQEATSHAEVIAMTGYPTPENEARILECGARICLTKPLDMKRLLAEVDKSV